MKLAAGAHLNIQSVTDTLPAYPSCVIDEMRTSDAKHRSVALTHNFSDDQFDKVYSPGSTTIETGLAKQLAIEYGVSLIPLFAFMLMLETTSFCAVL